VPVSVAVFTKGLAAIAACQILTQVLQVGYD
jgi:hypothetical protein